MIDGTGIGTYEYDQLERLTATKDGHGDSVAYEYNLANEPDRRSPTPRAKRSRAATTTTGA